MDQNNMAISPGHSDDHTPSHPRQPSADRIEVDDQEPDKSIYTCNNCRNTVEICYRCTVCDVTLHFTSLKL